MAWTAAGYPEGVHGVPPAEQETELYEQAGWGGRPDEPTDLTWEPWVAGAIQRVWKNHQSKALRKE
eukprot:3163309-Lingulodinium_polyedra.AAC.1